MAGLPFLLWVWRVALWSSACGLGLCLGLEPVPASVCRVHPVEYVDQLPFRYGAWRVASKCVSGALPCDVDGCG